LQGKAIKVSKIILFSHDKKKLPSDFPYFPWKFAFRHSLLVGWDRRLSPDKQRFLEKWFPK